MNFPKTIHFIQKYMLPTTDFDDMKVSTTAPSEDEEGELTAEYKLVRCGRVKVIKTIAIEPAEAEPTSLEDLDGATDIPY